MGDKIKYKNYGNAFKVDREEYEPPVEVFKAINEAQIKIRQTIENGIIGEIELQMGVKVDKEELAKALNYERDQYRKGYIDREKQISEKLDEMFKALEDELENTCPIEYLNLDPESFNDCCEEFCLSKGGTECWKAYVLGRPIGYYFT